MTPLVRSLLLGDADDTSQVLPRCRGDLLSAQYFDVTGVLEAADEMAWDVAYGQSPLSAEDLFLPAEPCVIEWVEVFEGHSQRTAWMLTRSGKTISGLMLFGHVKQWVCDGGSFVLFNEQAANPVVHPLEAWGCEADYERRCREAGLVPAGEVERLREALVDAEEVLSLVERPAHPDPWYHAEVKALGQRIGFGALMSTASAGWREVAEAHGDPTSGVFVAGPCIGTVQGTLRRIRAALAPTTKGGADASGQPEGDQP